MSVASDPCSAVRSSPRPISRSQSRSSRSSRHRRASPAPLPPPAPQGLLSWLFAPSPYREASGYDWEYCEPRAGSRNKCRSRSKTFLYDLSIIFLSLVLLLTYIVSASDSLRRKVRWADPAASAFESQHLQKRNPEESPVDARSPTPERVESSSESEEAQKQPEERNVDKLTQSSTGEFLTLPSDDHENDDYGNDGCGNDGYDDDGYENDDYEKQPASEGAEHPTEAEAKTNNGDSSDQNGVTKEARGEKYLVTKKHRKGEVPEQPSGEEASPATTKGEINHNIAENSNAGTTLVVQGDAVVGRPVLEARHSSFGDTALTAAISVGAALGAAVLNTAAGVPLVNVQLPSIKIGAGDQPKHPSESQSSPVQLIKVTPRPDVAKYVPPQAPAMPPSPPVFTAPVQPPSPSFTPVKHRKHRKSALATMIFLPLSTHLAPALAPVVHHIKERKFVSTKSVKGILQDHQRQVKRLARNSVKSLHKDFQQWHHLHGKEGNPRWSATDRPEFHVCLQCSDYNLNRSSTPGSRLSHRFADAGDSTTTLFDVDSAFESENQSQRRPENRHFEIEPVEITETNAGSSEDSESVVDITLKPATRSAIKNDRVATQPVLFESERGRSATPDLPNSFGSNPNLDSVRRMKEKKCRTKGNEKKQGLSLRKSKSTVGWNELHVADRSDDGAMTAVPKKSYGQKLCGNEHEEIRQDPSLSRCRNPEAGLSAKHDMARERDQRRSGNWIHA